ncbi:MAG: hypothetical protein H8K04_04555 [Nitrospira sp.]
MASASVTGALEPFTWKMYEVYLHAAIKSGYRFLGFDALADESVLPDAPFILLRHDIDYDPDWTLAISKIEAENHVRATYFFQADSPFYNLDSAGTILVIEELLRQGHWLGVHFDANRLNDDTEITEEVERAAVRFEVRFGVRLDAASFHMPTYRPVKHLRLKNKRVNTYSSLFFDRITYFSDSNQDWRGKDILRTLQEKLYARIQFLVHPIWWRETYSPFHVKLAELAMKLHIPVDAILTREQRDLLAKTQAN